MKDLIDRQPDLQPTCNNLATDAISRQKAIEVIDAVFPVDPMKSEYAQGIACGAALAKIYVEQLPPAQQEISCSEIPNRSDFVSRKAVREMVATWAYDLAEWEDMELALHDVDNLSPVQPEVINCKD